MRKCRAGSSPWHRTGSPIRSTRYHVRRAPPGRGPIPVLAGTFILLEDHYRAVECGGRSGCSFCPTCGKTALSRGVPPGRITPEPLMSLAGRHKAAPPAARVIAAPDYVISFPALGESSCTWKRNLAKPRRSSGPSARFARRASGRTPSSCIPPSRWSCRDGPAVPHAVR